MKVGHCNAKALHHKIVEIEVQNRGFRRRLVLVWGRGLKKAAVHLSGTFKDG